MKVLIFDTETGGLDPETASLLSVGVVVGDLDTGEILEQWEAFVKQDQYIIEEGAAKVHGITESYCRKNGLTIEEIADKFSDAYFNHGCLTVGGHNVWFDIRWVSKHIFECSSEEFTQNFSHRILDSMTPVRLATGVENIKQGATLKQTAKALKIDTSKIKSTGSGDYHGALFDTIVTFLILCKFRKVYQTEFFQKGLTS
jgi:DNA polymerase III epsilon subunit-like protein